MKRRRQRRTVIGPDDLLIHLPLPPKMTKARRRQIAQRAATQAIEQEVRRLARRPRSWGSILADPTATKEERSRAGKRQLCIRGGKAGAKITTPKMRKLGFPNLVKAREAKRQKREARARLIPREYLRYLRVDSATPAYETTICPGCGHPFTLAYQGQPACSNECGERVRRALAR